jgi:hypothetical protein
MRRESTREELEGCPVPSIHELPRETVRKGALRQWLGRVPSMRRAYQTDLSDAEWGCIEPLLPTPKAPGRPRVHSLREILNAIFYIVKSGCAWRLLPHDFPPWKTIQIVCTQMTKRLVRTLR